MHDFAREQRPRDGLVFEALQTADNARRHGIDKYEAIAGAKGSKKYSDHNQRLCLAPAQARCEIIDQARGVLRQVFLVQCVFAFSPTEDVAGKRSKMLSWEFFSFETERLLAANNATPSATATRRWFRHCRHDLEQVSVKLHVVEVADFVFAERRHAKCTAASSQLPREHRGQVN